MSTIENKKIAIIGGGPGGLTLARLLQLNRAEVKVYERDINREARVKGATLDLHEDSGLKALREAGLLEAFKANYRPGADKVSIIDKNANIVFTDHGLPGVEISNPDEISQFGNENFRPEIDRGPLREILLNSLESDTVIWNSNFSSLLPQNNSWKIEFKNGTSALADIVIAADGANSRIRPYITSIKPFYSGITVVEGAVYDSETASPKTHRLLNGGKIFAMGSNKSLIISSKGDGSLVFYTGCKTDEQWYKQSGIDFSNKAQVVEWFKNEYSDWDSIWHEIFENASIDFIPRPQYCMPFDQTWTALPNLTMLGDAAHLMPPYAGEGVNMAMLDALELSNCLTSNSYSDIHSAIAAYEKQIRLRASEIAQITMQSTEALHAPDAITFLKNIIG